MNPPERHGGHAGAFDGDDGRYSCQARLTDEQDCACFDLHFPRVYLRVPPCVFAGGVVDRHGGNAGRSKRQGGRLTRRFLEGAQRVSPGVAS